MTDQKYCRNCGAPNLPEAKFCANCSEAFVSGDAAAPLSAASAASMPWEQQPQYSSSPEPRTIFGLSRKMVVIGIIALVVVLTLGCVVMASQSPSSSTPTPTAQATVVATATAKVTATAKATPTATPKATSSGASLTQSQLTAIEGLQVKNGFTILTHFKESSTDKDGDKSYEATMSKNGYTYDYTLDACHDTAKADSTFTTRIAAAKLLGAIGDYDDAYTWLGVMTYKGQPVGVGVQEMRDANPPVVISYVLA